VRRQAAIRFRALTFEKMSRSVLATNQPSAELSCLAGPAKLGSCDAFVSHSWHDCADVKWKTLAGWRDAFVRDWERQPSVWLDKCCIDQACIDEDLRALPIFLSGCSRLVICCGVTYLRRLWCIVELFTFVHMGGDDSDVDLFLLLREGRELQDREEIRLQMETFDAAQCECFDVQDKERMLLIIHAAYGDVHRFNSAVRQILTRTVAREFAEIDFDWAEEVICEKI
jgi:hypothetical protein